MKAKSSPAAVARAFIASGLEQMKAQYPDLRKFLEQRRTQKDGEELPVTKERSVPRESVKAAKGRKRKER